MSRRKVSRPPQHWQVKGLGSGSMGAGSPISPNMARIRSRVLRAAEAEVAVVADAGEAFG